MASFLLIAQTSPNFRAEQVISIFIMAAVLNFVGNRVCHKEQKLQSVARRIGVATFLLLFVVGFLADGGGAYLVTRLTQAGLLGWVLTGFLLVSLPIIAPVLSGGLSVALAPFRFVTSIFKWNRDRKLAAEREEQRRLQAEEWERARPERERQARLQEQRDALAREQEVEAERTARTEQQRRDDARYNLRLLFQRHYAEIRESISRTRFEHLVETEMGDQLPVDVVERKAKQMTEMILDFFEQVVPDNDHETLDNLRDSYENRREEILDASFDEETKASMLAQLKWEEDQASSRMKKR